MGYTPCNRYGVAGIVDDEGRHAVVDPALLAIQQGRAFRFSHRFSSVAAAAVVSILVDPSANGATTPLRLAVDIETGVDCSVEILEGTTTTADGTELVAYGLNRNADPSMNSVGAVYHTPTIDTSGNLALPIAYVDAALPADISYQETFGETGAGDAAHRTLPEIYLDRTKKYLIRVTNLGSGAGNIVVSGRIIREPRAYEGA